MSRLGLARNALAQVSYWPHNTALYVKDFRGSEPKFVYYYLRGFNTSVYSASTAVPTLNRNNLRDVVVNVPPLAEQRRIVAKLDQVLGKIDACHQRLAKVPDLLKRFRQSVLAAACSGRLTADWRQDNPNVEPYLAETDLTEELDQSSFPSSWRMTRVGKLTTLVTSGSRGWAKYYARSGAIFIRAQNINSDVLNLNDIAFVRPPASAEGQRTKVQQQDLLITITGANVTKSALVKTPLDAAYVSQRAA
jgi:type I restriction enzyme S subunit